VPGELRHEPVRQRLDVLEAVTAASTVRQLCHGAKHLADGRVPDRVGSGLDAVPSEHVHLRGVLTGSCQYGRVDSP
jgi:hypothetical protein